MQNFNMISGESMLLGILWLWIVVNMKIMATIQCALPVFRDLLVVQACQLSYDICSLVQCHLLLLSLCIETCLFIIC